MGQSWLHWEEIAGTLAYGVFRAGWLDVTPLYSRL